MENAGRESEGQNGWAGKLQDRTPSTADACDSHLIWPVCALVSTSLSCRGAVGRRRQAGWNLAGS